MKNLNFFLKKSIVAYISETVGDRAKRLKFGTFFFTFQKSKKKSKNINLQLFLKCSEITRGKWTKFGDHMYCQCSDTVKHFSTF